MGALSSANCGFHNRRLAFLPSRAGQNNSCRLATGHTQADLGYRGIVIKPRVLAADTAKVILADVKDDLA